MPSISVDGILYKVSEMSERGLRFRTKGRHSFEIGNKLMGVILFGDGSQVRVFGTVLRCDLYEVVVSPLEGVTCQRMVIEQLYVVREFPLR